MRKSIKPYLIFIGIVGLITLVLIIIILVSLLGGVKKQTSTTPQPSLTPVAHLPIPPEATIFPAYGEFTKEYHAQNDAINKKQEASLTQQRKVAALLPLLPYTGKNFSMSYDYKTYTFSIILTKTNRDEANKEFQNFLKNHNIDNQTWFKRLQIEEK